MGVWTNADKPEEAAQARGYGAEGIGLCRTEHMFREGDRLEIVRGAILVANEATRAQGQAGGGRRADRRRARGGRDLRRRDGQARGAPAGRLRGHLQGDGRRCPVVIRLIDPPLHEFLPNLEEQLVKVTRAESTGGASEEDQRAPPDDQVDARAEPDARPARRPARPDDPGLREGPDAGDPERPDQGQAGRRQPDREDHDPARRARERARAHARAARGRGEGRRGEGRRRGRLQVRDDDRGARAAPSPPTRSRARPSSSASARTT